MADRRVDERHLFLHTGHELSGLRLRTPRLELRLATIAELRALARLAQAGVHDPAEMPFEVAWTDNAGSPSFVDDFVEFHRTRLDASTPEDWRLELVAFADGGEPIGSQGIGATRFAVRREVSTGSWLGRDWQGRGLGTEQRAAVPVARLRRAGRPGGGLRGLGGKPRLPRGVAQARLRRERHEALASPRRAARASHPATRAR
jgi:RimJ/RimL family protein N-acetyltransferase